MKKNILKLTVILALLASHSLVANAQNDAYRAMVAVFFEICRLDIQQPETVMRQAILETGWMRAPFLMKRHNLFGFSNTTYMVFDDWKDSVAYYKSWQDKNYRAGEHKDYSAFLRSIRYASEGYTNHLSKIQWERTCPDKAPD